jgi:hypothetical protein
MAPLWPRYCKYRGSKRHRNYPRKNPHVPILPFLPHLKHSKNTPYDTTAWDIGYFAVSLQRPDQRLMCLCVRLCVCVCVCVCVCACRYVSNRSPPLTLTLGVRVAVVFKVCVTRKHYFGFVAVPGFATSLLLFMSLF